MFTQQAKAWNESSSEIVLVVHGFMDNAGSYDRLIPLLPKQYYYVCIDLPGHGLSDHFHESKLLITLDYTLTFKVLVDYFKREKYVIIGHSYGAQISMVFCQLYPQHVSKLIILDAITFKPINFFHSVGVGMDIILKNKQLNNKKTYTYEEAIEKLMTTRAFGKPHRETAINLAKRALKKVGEDQFTFRMDIRLKERLSPTWELDYVKETHLKFPLKCQCLFIFFNESPFTRIFKLMYEYFRERKFEIHHLDGNHDCHMTNPEVLVPIITEFLLRKSKM